MKPRVALLAVFVSACHAAATPSPGPVPTPVPTADPGALGFDPVRLDSVAVYLRSQVDSAFPGAVVAVGRHGRLALLAAVGHYGLNDPRPVDPATIYDLASLTKVIGLTSACLLLVQSGRLDLDAPVRRYLPQFAGAHKDGVTIRNLLTHSSGLPGWRPLFREARNRSQAFALVDTTPLLRAPGDTFVYSDLGAIVLTQIVERLTGERLDRYLAAHVFEPLGMSATRYLPPKSWRDHIAPTENDTVFRHRILRGEVHDENAGRLDGVSGHAGLFSTAPDLARFAAWMLERWHSDTGDGKRQAGDTSSVLPSPISSLPGTTIREWTRRQGIPPGSTRAIGWDTPSDSGYSSAGTQLSRRSFGHTGFTGTSIWMDPTRDLFVILLTNRVNPTRTNGRVQQVRPRVADLVVAALLEDSSGRSTTIKHGQGQSE